MYCQNFAISGGEVGEPASIEEVADMMLALEGQGALNINLVTPTHFADGARSAVGYARERGMKLPVIWNTSGYENAEQIRKNAGCVDAYLTDFKYFSNNVAKELSGVSDYFEKATSALDAMVECAGPLTVDEYNGEERMAGGVIVRHLLLPGLLEDSKRVLEHLHFRYGNSIRLSIMNQYTPVVAEAAAKGIPRARRLLEARPEFAKPVPSEQYEELLDFADALGIEDYYWQDGEACLESFIPEFQV